MSVSPHRPAAAQDAIGLILDECAAARAVMCREEAAAVRRLARAWEIAQDEMARTGSADTARREVPLRSLAAQIAVELQVNDRTVQAQMYDASVLVESFPATVGAMDAGRLTRAHARVLLEYGRVLVDDPAVRAEYEEAVIEVAARETVARTCTFARRWAEALHPIPAQERFDTAAQARSVVVVDLDDGMAQLIATLPATIAHGIRDRLTRQAIAIRDADRATRRERLERARSASEPEEPGASDVAERAKHLLDDSARPGPEAGEVVDERTRDQVRADVFSDLLLTGAPAIDPTGPMREGGLGAIRAEVQIVVPVTTLAGSTHSGAELDGRVPIDPATARRLACGNAVWERVMTHPVTGIVLTVDRYRPTPEQQRMLRARDVTCRWPGCRTPVRYCQVDHNHEWHDGGRTDVGNLAHLCIRHHTLKTETAWTVAQHPGGELRFTTPTGREHTTLPTPHVVFVPEPDPPPF